MILKPAAAKLDGTNNIYILIFSVEEGTSGDIII